MFSLKTLARKGLKCPKLMYDDVLCVKPRMNYGLFTRKLTQAWLNTLYQIAHCCLE